MGARISGAGTATIVIHGVERLRPIDHTVMPDRIEAGTLMLAAAITRGDVLVEGADPTHLGAVIAKLREAGARVEESPAGVRVEGPARPRAVDIKTGPYPEFPTDMQAQFMALLAVSRGLGVIHETIFENRYVHVAELKRLGADITLDGNLAIVRGKAALSGARVMATDLQGERLAGAGGAARRGRDRRRPRLSSRSRLRATRREARRHRGTNRSDQGTAVAANQHAAALLSRSLP